MKKPAKHPTGLTKITGYQIGARRTINLPPAEAWELATSLQGVNLWLGPTSHFSFEEGTRYELTDGSYGTIRVYTPGSHLRLTWQPAGWPRPSTIQVRVIPKENRSIIAFHQEYLPGAAEREERREHFIRALDALEKISG
jgi:uncharacterized protein YndB with AHSA1/START domain